MLHVGMHLYSDGGISDSRGQQRLQQEMAEVQDMFLMDIRAAWSM